MKLVELITTPECQHIYQRYFKIIANPKKPHQITSKQIYQEIVNYYNEDYHHIINILCLEEITFLKELDIHHTYRKDIPIINTLINKCLVIKNPHNDNYLEIPDDLKDSVELALKLVNYEVVAKNDQINEILVGILALRGIIEPQELIEIYLKYDDSHSFKEIQEHLNTNHYLFQHYFIYQGNDELLLAYEPYHPIIQEIEHLQSLNTKVAFDYTKSQLQLIARYGLDLSNPPILALYQTIEALDNVFLRELLRDSIILYCQVHGDINELLTVLKDSNLTKASTIAALEAHLKVAMPLIHSAAFFGMPPYDYYLLTNQYSFFSEQESSLFYRLYLSLLEYVNELFNVTKLSIKELDYVDQSDLFQVRTLLFSHPEIIDRYISENPHYFTSYELAIINQFKDGIIDEFLILKNTSDYTIISDEQTVYAIYGLVNHLKEIYPNSSLPQVCRLALLPYKHKIIFDGLLDDGPSLHIKKQRQHYQMEDILFELPNHFLN